MNNDNLILGEMLRRAVPPSGGVVEFDEVASRVRRKRARAAWIGGAGAVGVVLLATGIAMGQYDGPDRGRDPSVADEPTGLGARTEAPLVGCPPTAPYRDGKVVMVSYVSFIQLGGQQFVGHLDVGAALPQDDLGEQVATVTCRIADLTASGREHVVGGFREGNAAYMNAGTPIYAVDGYAATCRVAVIENGQVIAYLAQHEVNNHSVPTVCATDPATNNAEAGGDGSAVTVSTHCGVLSVTVDGQLWLATPPLGEHNPPQGWDENDVSGTFTKTDHDTAEFNGENGEVASFRLAHVGESDPNAGCE